MTASLATPGLDVERLTRLRRVGELAVSPCGRYVVVSVQRLTDSESRYVSDLWKVWVDDGAGREPVQLTWGEANDRCPRVRRDGSIGFLSNRSPAGAEPEEGERHRYQVWLLPAAGGEPRRLTDEPLGASDFRFAAAADRMVVVADVLPGVEHDRQREQARDRAKRGPSGLHYTAMPVRHWDHWEPITARHLIAYDERGEGRRDLTPNANDEHRGHEFGLSWDLSADGTRVAAVKIALADDRLHDAVLRVIDVDSGEHRDLGEGQRIELGDPLFAPDSRQLACTRTPRPIGKPGKVDLWLIDTDTGTERSIAPDWDAWPTPQAWTSDGSALLATADWRGAVPVFRVDVAGGEVTRLSSEQAAGCHGALAIARREDGDLAVGLRHRMHHPPEPFCMPLAPGATPELIAGLSGFTEDDGRSIARIESFEVTGDGGAAVQSFALVPEGGEGPRPTLVWIHGGPMGQFADGWHWRWNPLIGASHGYTMVLPNPRGSTGFGQRFIEGIWGNTWGAACYRDLMAVTDAVCARDDVDPDRVGAMGGSFGGYMANWIGSQTDRFRCLMTHAGLYCLSAFYGTTDYPAFSIYETGFSPYDDLDEFDRYSPHRYVGQWKTPTLVIHGEKDYRVPVSEALMLFEALQLHEVPSELLVFPDENHWIAAPRNVRQWYREVFRFADQYLK